MPETDRVTFSQYYRNRAKACREAGNSFRDPRARAKMFELAIDYEAKAKESQADEYVTLD